jgi:hypothetical protein
MVIKRAVNHDVEYRALDINETDDEAFNATATSSALEIDTSRSKGEHRSPKELVREDRSSSTDALVGDNDSSKKAEPNSRRKLGYSCCKCFKCCSCLFRTRTGLSVLSTAVTLLVSAVVFLYIACRPVPYVSRILPLTDEPAVFNNTVNVFLVGDSMWGIPQVSCFLVISLG